jgi:anti-sigma regulatory factor (Ser/Thr protein kinase)
MNKDIRSGLREELIFGVRDEIVTHGMIRPSATTWPLVSHLELGALPTAAASARKHARAVALEFGLSLIADTVELVTSELVTNSVRAAQYVRDSGLEPAVVRLWLACGPQGLLILVWDASNQMPARLKAAPDDETGRGLMLVDCLAEWGAYRAGRGKVVWAVVSLADQPGICVRRATDARRPVDGDSEIRRARPDTGDLSRGLAGGSAPALPRDRTAPPVTLMY